MMNSEGNALKKGENKIDLRCTAKGEMNDYERYSAPAGELGLTKTPPYIQTCSHIWTNHQRLRCPFLPIWILLNPNFWIGFIFLEKSTLTGIYCVLKLLIINKL